MKFDGGIFHAGGVFSVSPLALQPSVWQTNGGYHSIQHGRKVQKQPSKAF